MTPIVARASSAARRTRAMRSMVPSTGPWAKESRAMFMPAAIIPASVAGLSDAGPTVATILVLRSMSADPTGRPEDWRKHRKEREDTVLLLRAPAVYPAQGDTWLLTDALAAENLRPSTRVLDVCTGSGALAVAAAKLGAADVTAVDISRRAVVSSWLNTRCRRLP